MHSEKDHIIDKVRNWLNNFVLKLNLCPFAHKVAADDMILYVVADHQNEETLLIEVYNELMHLRMQPQIKTSLIIIPNMLGDFDTYLDFLEYCDQLLVNYGFEGEFQIASFHPDYRFGDVSENSLKHYSNRSPFPLLHLLREEDVELAIQSHQNIHDIPKTNEQTLNALGIDEIRKILRLKK